MGRRVLRNNTTHDDAVYVVSCGKVGNDYVVIGLWGKWNKFTQDGILPSKVYYWEQPVQPTPKAAPQAPAPRPAAPKTPDPRQVTRAGVLEWEE